MLPLNDDVLEQNESTLHSAFTRRRLAGDPDDEYIKSLEDRADLWTTGLLNAKFSNKQAKQAERQRDFDSSLNAIASWHNAEGSAEDYAPEVGDSLPEGLIGTEAEQVLLSDPKINAKARRQVTYDLMKLGRGEDNMMYALKRWAHRQDEVLPASDASELAKSMGSDIKFDKPQTLYNIDQAVFLDKRKKSLEYNLGVLQTGGDLGLLNDLTVMGAGMAGAVGPVELVTSTAVGVFAPELLVGGLAKAGTMVKSAAQTKRAIDIASEIKTLKTINNVYKAASGAETSLEVQAMILPGKGLGSFDKAFVAKEIAKRERALKAVRVLDEIEGMSYDSLGKAGKMGLDTLTYTVTDIPYINASRSTSEELGLDIYSEKDRMVDSLMAFGLGVGLPGMVRYVGEKAFHMTPKGLVLNRLDRQARDLDVKEALGDITPEKAAEGRQAISTLRSYVTDESNFKKPHPSQISTAEALAKVNTTDEELTTAMMYSYQKMLSNSTPTMEDLPAFHSRMSHIDARVLRGLFDNPATAVFGSNLMRSVTESGLEKVFVSGETGLMGQFPVTGFFKGESDLRLEQFYKGFVLDDEAARNSFKEWARSFDEFTKTLEDISARDIENIRKNIKAKARGEEAEVRLANQVDKYSEMKEAYLRYALGDEAYKQQKDIQLSNTNTEILGFEPEAHSADWERALEDFEDWFSQHVSRTSKFQDFIDKSGKPDQGKAFSRFVSDLREASEANKYNASLDETLLNALKENAQGNLEKMMRLEVSPDTTSELLMGVPRVTREELQNIDRDLTDLDNRVALARLDYNRLKNSEATRDVYNNLMKYSQSKEGIDSDFTLAVSRIDAIQAAREAGYTGIVNDLVDAFRAKPELQEKLMNVFAKVAGPSGEHGFARAERSLRFSLKEALQDALQKSEVYAVLRGSEKRELLRDVLGYMTKEIHNNPKALDAFMSPETLKAMYKVQEDVPLQGEGFGREGVLVGTPLEEKAKIVAEAQAHLQVLTSSISASMDRALSAIELQAHNTVAVGMRKFEAMCANPEIAAEILTGAATQTQYAFKGSHRSVETQTKTAVMYVNDLFNKLRNMDISKGGTNLYEYAVKPENWGDIKDALVRAYHGEPISDNTDAARVAQAMLDQEASFLSRFRDMGAIGDVKLNLIDRNKLRYSDVAISDEEISDMFDYVSKALDVDPALVLDNIVRDSAGALLRGNQFVESEVKAKKFIESKLREIQGTLRNFANLEDASHRNNALWALRDWDLDRMFDADGNLALSLNEVRDALLQGDLTRVIDGDLQNLSDMSAALTYLKNRLLGRETTGGILGTTGYIFRMRSEVNNLAASVTGKQAAALGILKEGGILFKNADAELNAVSKFGHNDIKDLLQKNYSTMFNAYYAMKEFGSTPGDTATMLIDAYNRLVRDTGNAKFRKYLTSRAKKSGRDVEKSLLAKMTISEGAKDSVLENVALACGLHNQAPSAAVRVIKALNSFLASSLLMKAGLKSFADYGTIWSGLTMNEMVRGRFEAIALTSEAGRLVRDVKDIRDLVLAAGILDRDTLIKYVANDPGIDPIQASAQYNMLDKLEKARQGYSDLLMNKLGRMESVTNSNKAVAAASIQLAYGKFAETPFKQLPENLQIQFLREGFDEKDWDFIRQYMVHDVASYIAARNPNASPFQGGSYKILIPQSIMNIDDSVIAKELQNRGVLNINTDVINSFKEDMLAKAWISVDASADEMISMPSQRITSWMRGGKARNSGAGIAMEILTMFQSFGASLSYNTYFKHLANLSAKETGITALDLFSPTAKLNKVGRSDVYTGLLGLITNVALVSLAVDSAVSALAGNVQMPIDKKGNIHPDMLMSSAFGALGTTGVLLDAMYEGVEGSGQRGGGFSLQVGPSVSNYNRSAYRLLKPLRSSKIAPEDKPAAFFAGSAQELSRYSGLKSTPVIGPLWQIFLGAQLDEMYAGGKANYREQLKKRENRGYVIMPWEKDPRAFYDGLQ